MSEYLDKLTDLIVKVDTSLLTEASAAVHRGPGYTGGATALARAGALGTVSLALRAIRDDIKKD